MEKSFTPDREATLMLEELLRNNTSVWHIIYDGFKANHISHGLIALYKLGASSDRLQQFYDNCCAQSALQPTHAPHYSVTLQEMNDHSFKWKTLCGNKENFTDLKLFFQNEWKDIKEDVKKKHTQLDRKDELNKVVCKAIVSKFFPEMMDGIIEHAFHGMIQLGYGLEVMNESCVVEGLAFLASVYQPMKAPLAIQREKDRNSININDWSLHQVLNRLRGEQRVQDVLNDQGFQNSRFLGRVRHIEQHCMDLIAEYDNLPLLTGEWSEEDLKKQLYSIWKQILRVYAGSGMNFFVLHCVTGTRAFQQIFDQLESVEDKRKSLLHLWRSYIMSFIAVKAPEIDYSKSNLDAQLLAKTPSWDTVIQEALKVPVDRKENIHDLKVVFSCYWNDKEIEHDELHRVVSAKQMKLLEY